MLLYFHRACHSSGWRQWVAGIKQCVCVSRSEADDLDAAAANAARDASARRGAAVTSDALDAAGGGPLDVEVRINDDQREPNELPAS